MGWSGTQLCMYVLFAAADENAPPVKMARWLLRIDVAKTEFGIKYDLLVNTLFNLIVYKILVFTSYRVWLQLLLLQLSNIIFKLLKTEREV